MDHGSMHGNGHEPSSETEATPSSSGTPIKGCVMKGTCKGPMSAILAVLSTHGVPPMSAFGVAPDFTSTAAAAVTRQHAISHLPLPETPPPRG
jgi:hypothetical protein